LDDLERIHNFWRAKLGAIPDADPQHKLFADVSGVNRLNEYGALVIIDGLALKYPAYKHDEIFNLDLSLVYQLLAIGKQRDYINHTAAQMRRASTKK
jgi:hypothetical protein